MLKLLWLYVRSLLCMYKDLYVQSHPQASMLERRITSQLVELFWEGAFVVAVMAGGGETLRPGLGLIVPGRLSTRRREARVQRTALSGALGACKATCLYLSGLAGRGVPARNTRACPHHPASTSWDPCPRVAHHPRTAPPAAKQLFEYTVLWATFHIQIVTPKSSMAAETDIPAFRSLRQEYCHKFTTVELVPVHLGYRVRRCIHPPNKLKTPWV